MPTRRFASLPDRIGRLEELAYNLKWSWDYRARLLFKRLDPELWKVIQHNPVKLLNEIDTERLTHASRDPDFLREYDRNSTTFTVRPGTPLADVERTLIRQTLTHVTSNREDAAKALGISRRALQYKLKQYGLLREPAPSIIHAKRD